jgi:hypothetical protein
VTQRVRVARAFNSALVHVHAFDAVTLETRMARAFVGPLDVDAACVVMAFVAKRIVAFVYVLGKFFLNPPG